MIDRRAVIMAGAGAAALAACNTEMTPTSAPDRTAALSGYALNVESWFRDLPFLERFDAAARAGFSHVEMWETGGDDRTLSAVRRRAADAGVKIAQIVGSAGELARTGGREAWLAACRTTVEHAARLDCGIATVVGHRSVEGISVTDSLSAYGDHLAAAAPIFQNAGVVAAIEPFNPYDHPGFFIYGSHDAAAMVRAIGSDFVRLNYDLFHMQRAEGELIGGLRRNADVVGYVQIADAPDRAQPGTGDVNWANVIGQVRAGGYDKPIGLELWAEDDDYAQAVQDILSMTADIGAVRA